MRKQQAPKESCKNSHKTDGERVFVENTKCATLQFFTSTSWPSGLRRNVKAVVFVGVGSNPTDVTLLRKLPLLLKVVRTLSIVAGSNSTRVIFWYQQRQLLYYDFPAGARSLSFSYIIGPYCASSKTKTKSSSEGRIIESSLGRKLNLAFRRNYDRSGDYCRQSTVG